MESKPMKMIRRLVASAALLAAVALALPAAAQTIPQGQPFPSFKNLLDNGWFNIYQRGTTAVTTITTTATYHADRWAGYSGTSTNLTLTNVTSALPTGTGTPGFTNAEQIQRASGQTGVVKTCLVQEIPTSDTTPLAGQPVTLSFWALAGANFSAAGNAMVPSVVTGTGTDEGLATLISGWAGAGTWSSAGASSVALTSGWQRYAITGIVPAGTTEMAASFCFTPVGTAGTNDYFQITGVQLEQGDVATNLEQRPYGFELGKVQRYYFRASEVASAVTTLGLCEATSTTAATCTVPAPNFLRAAPTSTVATGTMKVSIAGTATALSGTAAASAASSVYNCAVTTTVASGQTAGQIEYLLSGNSTGGGYVACSADF
jgi:hypothetical protein